MDKTSFLDETRSDYSFDVATTLKGAKDTLGRTYFSVVKEMFRLSRGIGKLNPQEYLFYRLYSDAFSEADKAVFLGTQAMKELDIKFLKNAWTHVSADKLVLNSLLAGLGLPHSTTFALYHPFRTCGDVAYLRSAEALAGFLRKEARYPFFSKPATGVNSLGVVPVDAYDAASDSLVLANGSSVAVERYIAEIDRYRDQGYCFQDRLMPHAGLVELCGPRISSIRVFVIMGPDGPEILRASWKISVGDNVADNFWRRGNLLAALDAESGAVTRLIQGAGPEQVELEEHPDTGKRLLGSVLPEWQRLREVVSAGAAALPSCKIQGWDVVITDNGPLLLELEGDGGHPQMVQLPQAAGLYQGRFKAFYDDAKAKAEADNKKSKKSKTAKSKAAA